MRPSSPSSATSRRITAWAAMISPYSSGDAINAGARRCWIQLPPPAQVAEAFAVPNLDPQSLALLSSDFKLKGRLHGRLVSPHLTVRSTTHMVFLIIRSTLSALRRSPSPSCLADLLLGVLHAASINIGSLYLSFRPTHPTPPRCRSVGAVHSIIGARAIQAPDGRSSGDAPDSDRRRGNAAKAAKCQEPPCQRRPAAQGCCSRYIDFGAFSANKGDADEIHAYLDRTSAGTAMETRTRRSGSSRFSRNGRHPVISRSSCSLSAWATGAGICCWTATIQRRSEVLLDASAFVFEALTLLFPSMMPFASNSNRLPSRWAEAQVIVQNFTFLDPAGTGRVSG